MASGSRRAATPGIGRAPRAKRVLVWGALALSTAALYGVYVYLGQVLRIVEREAITSSEPEDPWVEFHKGQLTRTGMLKLDQKAELVWDDIQVLQKEIDAYQKQYSELKVSEEGKRLIEDEWTVRYFADKWGERLPRQKVARHCGERLNELMLAVREALRETAPARERPAFVISAETKRELELIEFEVDTAREVYTRHRLLLDALEASVAEGRPVVPKNLDDASQQLLHEIIKREFRGRSGDKQSDAAEHPDKSADKSSEASAEQESATLDTSSLHRDVRRSQVGTGEGSPNAMLGRDTVRDRDEPPRRRIRP